MWYFRFWWFKNQNLKCDIIREEVPQLPYNFNQLNLPSLLEPTPFTYLNFNHREQSYHIFQRNCARKKAWYGENIPLKNGRKNFATNQVGYFQIFQLIGQIHFFQENQFHSSPVPYFVPFSLNDFFSLF